MSVPRVVIVGRPNVGKSSLFNWLARKRLAIVDDRPGVTRDRLTFVASEGEHYFELVDTGGIGFVDPDQLTDKIEHQIDAAIDMADVIVVVVDARSGLAPQDYRVVERVRRLPVPVLGVVNKTDDATFDSQTAEFYKLGFDRLILVSTLQNRNRQELLDAIVAALPPQTGPVGTEQPVMKVAIVGRRNVGKSTFVNTLAHEERCIVSEVPGTTRDSVDVRFELDGKSFVAIDTPGLRRRKSVSTDIDFYSMHRAARSVRRADVVLLFFDAAQPISRVDKQLCDTIVEHYKPCILVVNKWDLYAGKVATEEWVQYLHAEFPSMHYAPIAFVTGQTGKNVKTLLNHAQMLFKQSHERLATPELNRVIKAALLNNPPPLYQNRRPKVYYGTQVQGQPPTLVLFCNEPEAFSEPYRRYLLNFFRDALPFGEIPIRLLLRERGERRGRPGAEPAEPIETEEPVETIDDDAE